MHKIEDVIKGAWNHPDARKWSPNTNPTCTVRVRPKAPASKLILPPGMMPASAENLPIYDVFFKCEFGMAHGAPAYQITGTCKGTTIVVAEGFLEKQKPVQGPAEA
jgi:hypothetical protein